MKVKVRFLDDTIEILTVEEEFNDVPIDYGDGFIHYKSFYTFIEKDVCHYWYKDMCEIIEN